jgi:hypothetical protein
MSPTEEIRAIRRELAAQFDNDLDRIFADVRQQQQESGREYITLPKREPRHQRMPNHGMQRSDGGNVPASDTSTPTAR